MSQLSFADLHSRLTDPETSRTAARAVEPGDDEHTTLIRKIVWEHGPLSQFEIAGYVDEIQPGRWSSASTRTACARAGLSVWPHAQGLTPRGRKCNLYHLEVLETSSL